MMHKFKLTTAALALGAATALASGAQASTLIDFTDRDIWSDEDSLATSSANYGSLTVDLSSNPEDRLDFTQNFDGPSGTGLSGYCSVNGGLLACDSDGLGVVDDEIAEQENSVTPPLQSVTVDFSKAVKVTAVHFLDLFFQQNADGDPVASEDQEKAWIYANGDRTNEVSFTAQDAFSDDGGYGMFENPFAFNINSLTFYSDTGNEVGAPDYALAAISVAPVPLPAAGWLLLAGIGGLGALRRFRKT